MSFAERRRFLANADADADRLVLLVTRLLDLARADMTTADPDTSTDLAIVVRRSADAARHDDLAVAVDMPAGLGAVAAPAATLEAILSTLIENSRNAGAARVTIAAQERDGDIRLTVADDGRGIAPADRDRIFEPFFTTRRSTGGSGLGLAIARSLLAAVGGSIESVAADRGALFALHLPHARRRD
jgi:signal transduction histidine kinase